MSRQKIKAAPQPQDSAVQQPETKMLSAVAKGRLWFDQLTRGAVSTLTEIAERDGVSSGRVSQLVKLATLSPKIVQAIVDGRQPVDLTVKTFSRLETIRSAGPIRKHCSGSELSFGPGRISRKPRTETCR